MDRAAAGTLFRNFLDALPQGLATRLHILTDADADGLPAAAILMRALHRAGFESVTAEPRRKFENAWMPEVRQRIGALDPEALLVLDLGSRAEPLLAGVPTLLIDHHAPFGTPPDATLLTGYGTEPTPTTGLLAYWCALALDPVRNEDLLWLAGISLLSDLGERAPFPELALARERFGATAMKELTSLLNAPRRTASGDASPALALLVTGSTPKQILKSAAPELEALIRAKAEVSAALADARRARPYFSDQHREELGAQLVAVRIDTPVQVHPLVAQTWRSRFPQSVVFGVNFGFRPGFVHFAGRAPAGVALLHFLRRRTPPGADATFGGGHDQAAGGALPAPVWNDFARELGFGPELLADSSLPLERAS